MKNIYVTLPQNPQVLAILSDHVAPSRTTLPFEGPSDNHISFKRLLAILPTFKPCDPSKGHMARSCELSPSLALSYTKAHWCARRVFKGFPRKWKSVKESETGIFSTNALFWMPRKEL